MRAKARASWAVQSEDSHAAEVALLEALPQAAVESGGVVVAVLTHAHIQVRFDAAVVNIAQKAKHGHLGRSARAPGIGSLQACTRAKKRSVHTPVSALVAQLPSLALTRDPTPPPPPLPRAAERLVAKVWRALGVVKRNCVDELFSRGVRGRTPAPEREK